MMVIDPIMSNKSAPTIATASSKLVSRKPPKRGNSSKRSSESLKRNTAKELKSTKVERSKSPGRQRKSPGPPTRKLSRKISTSSKASTSSKTSSKKDKKKKIKKVSSDNSLHKRGVENMDAASNVTPPAENGSSPLGNSSTHSESSKKKPKRNRSSKMAKKAIRDTNSVAEYMKNNELSPGSEHTQSTKTSDCTASTRDISDKEVIIKRGKKPLEKTTSKKGIKKKDKTSLPEEDKSSRVSPPKPPAAVGSPRNHRLLSFESIHGKSIHKPKTRRNRGNSEGADKYITTLAPPPPSPQPQHAILGSTPSTGEKKKSVLKAMREKQEQERRVSLEKKKNTDCMHDVLDIVQNKSHNSLRKSRKSIDPPTGNTDNFVDPDECSSQSSSCSVVSDGSFEKDDLLSNASDRSDERDSRYENMGSLLDENPSFGEHSITIDDDHELSPSKFSPNKISLSGAAFTPEVGNSTEESFSDSLMATMTSSMSALTEVDEGESPMNSPEGSARRQMPQKSLLKKIPATSTSSSKSRMMPKRAKSDITSLNRMSNNLLEIRLPGQRKTITRQRSLTFNEKVRVKRVPCQAQVCRGDTSDLWFQPQEYDSIKRKTMALIRAVQDDQTGGVTYCTRGLERYFAVDAVQERRNEAWDSVLDEQEAQRSNQEAFNAERISRTYSQTTQNSAQEAMERGKLDQDAIARYTKKIRQTLRRTYSNAV